MKYKEIKAVHSVLANVRIALDGITGTKNFIARKIQAIPEFQNGVRTDTIAGYSYDCVDTRSYNQYTIKVKGQTTPVMSDEQLQQIRESGKNVILTFTNPTVYMYYNTSTMTYEDSFSADAVSIVPEK